MWHLCEDFVVLYLTPSHQDGTRSLLQLIDLNGGVRGHTAVTGHSLLQQHQERVVQLRRDTRDVHQSWDLGQTADRQDRDMED